MMTHCSFNRQLVLSNSKLLGKDFQYFTWMQGFCFHSDTRASVSFQFFPKVLRSRFCVGQSSSATPDSINNFFMYLIYSCWKIKIPHQTCHKFESTQFPRMSLNGGTFRFLFCRAQTLWFLWALTLLWGTLGTDRFMSTRWWYWPKYRMIFLVARLHGKWYAFRSSWEVPPYESGSHNYNVQSFWFNRLITSQLPFFFFLLFDKDKMLFFSTITKLRTNRMMGNVVLSHKLSRHKLAKWEFSGKLYVIILQRYTKCMHKL